MKTRKTPTKLVVSVAALLFIGTTFAAVTQQDPLRLTRVRICVKDNGQLRMMTGNDTTCDPSERSMDWVVGGEVTDLQLSQGLVGSREDGTVRLAVDPSIIEGCTGCRGGKVFAGFNDGPGQILFTLTGDLATIAELELPGAGISNAAQGGHGVNGRGGEGIGELGLGGFGVVGNGGFSMNGSGGGGVLGIGGSSDNGGGGLGLQGSGGDSSTSFGGDGLVASRGSGPLGDGLAGSFFGNVEISGDLNVTGTKNFKIDHPLDLYHAAIESSEVLNVYSGNVITDQSGDAVVRLPDWFEALNKDPRYQLTVIGTFAQAIVASEIRDNRFTIKTSAPNVKVSWHVTGVRSDVGMRKHPFQAEQDKPKRERGTYLNPEAYGQPEERGVEWARNPELMRQMKHRRQQTNRNSQFKIKVERDKAELGRDTYLNPETYGQLEERSLEWGRNPARMRQLKQRRIANKNLAINGAP